MTNSDLKDAWWAYCADRFPDLAEMPDPLPVSPREAAMLLFEAGFMFTARMGAIKATPYSPAFDEEADGALAYLANLDDLDGWDRMSAGAWRVMFERYVYAQVVCGANAVARTPVIAHLPRGLDRQSQSRALLLQFLLGGARTIDPRLLEKHSREGLPGPETLKPIRKQ